MSYFSVETCPLAEDCAECKSGKNKNFWGHTEAQVKDKIAWQLERRDNVDPLIEFKKRQKEGKVKPLGYEDTPKGGIQLPMASFGMGGEFGVGGKVSVT